MSRRDFAALSVGSLSTLALSKSAFAAAQCVAGSMPLTPPNLLTVNCASRANFQQFRRYSSYIGLAGVVCVKPAVGAHGSYGVGTLILYPWLKPTALRVRGFAQALSCSLPKGASTSASMPGMPIPNAFLPQDEYLCRFLLEAPWQNFIGFTVDTPAGGPAMPTWRTILPKLADGMTVEIDWGSANLNPAWFAGANAIPAGPTCNGAVWRQLIANAVSQASASAC